MSTPLELRGLLYGSDTEYLISDHRYRKRDLAAAVGEAVGVVVSGPIMTPSLPALRRVWFGLDTLEAAGAGHEALVATAQAQVTPADAMVIVHTSGSTSAPKGVIHTHGSLIRHIRRLNEARAYTAEDRLFANSPFFWIGGFGFSLLATFIAGARLVCSSADPGAMLDLIEAERPTVTNGFAGGIAHLARDPSFKSRDLSSLKRGNLYPIMAPEARPKDPELRHAMLGMTEAGSVCLYESDESDQPESKRGSFGRPAPGLEIRVVDPETGEEGMAGEMWLRGPAMMQGYYGRERHETFTPDGWYRSGDLVTVDADGHVFFKGRKNDMIKTAGANVSPREVEPFLSEAAGGRQALVLGLPDADRGQIVAGVVIGDEPVDEAALQEHLKAKLSRYKVPRRIVAMRETELPMLSSGKVDMKRLMEMVGER